MLLIKEDNLGDYLIGSLNYRACEDQTPVSELVDTYKMVSGHGFTHLPLSFIADLSVLIKDGYSTSFISDEKDAEEDQEKEILLNYERHWASRLLQCGELHEAREYLGEGKLGKLRFERLLILMCRKFAESFPKTVHVNPAQVRNLKNYLQSEDEALEKFLEENENPFPELLAGFTDRISQSFQWSTILQDQDFFELEHLESLTTDHLRVGCRQIIEVKNALDTLDITRIDSEEDNADVDTDFVDETVYPSGGIAGITNRGPLENLVLSELVYMDSESEFDLFDMRYIEGELLYYMRDSGQLRRKRRTVNFVFDLSDIFSHKSMGYMWQFSVLSQGICLRMMNDLFRVFENDSLQMRLHYLVPPENHAMADDIKVMEILLADYVNHGWVSFSKKEKLNLEKLIDKDRKSYAVIFSSSNAAKWQDDINGIEKLRLNLNCSQLQFIEEDEDPISDFSLLMSGAPLHEICEIKDQLLINIV